MGNETALGTEALDTSIQRLRVFPGLIVYRCYLVPLPVFRQVTAGQGQTVTILIIATCNGRGRFDEAVPAPSVCYRELASSCSSAAPGQCQ